MHTTADRPGRRALATQLRTAFLHRTRSADTALHAVFILVVILYFIISVEGSTKIERLRPDLDYPKP